ncbi:MAG: glycosyltransferase family 39 protein [Phycisphaerales bacterium]|nr:glycosyltransferase family 39 protein [Phycisphaerales bacterium]
MADVKSRQNRFVRFVESAPYPSILLLIPIALLYGGSLRWGFMLDDYRHLHVMEQYQSAERDTLHLFRFLTSAESNAAARRDGSHPWWLGDDVRYQHWRPAAEAMLYGEYLVFGRHAVGYRFVTLLAYWLGAWLVYRLFCHLAQCERAARWGALAFTTFACHAIPTVFISAQADVVVLVLCCALILLALRCATTGSVACLVPMAILFALSLGFKEACLPVAVLPAALGIVAYRGAPRRKLFAASALMLAVGFAWMMMYSRGGFGSNTLVMLDPIRRPVEYALAFPIRAMLLLTSLVIPVNPFIFYFRPRGEPFVYVFCILGLIALVGACRGILRRASGDRIVGAMVLWVLVFVPLLVCTVPDDRILMLPSVGFAYLVGVWIAGGREIASPRIRRLPILLFFVVHATFAFGSTRIMRLVESQTIVNHKKVAQLIGETGPDDVVFFLDSNFDLQVLFAQRIFQDVNHLPTVGMRFLSESESLNVRRTARNKLELSDGSQGLFASFLGDMAVTRANPKKTGDVFDAGEVTGRILRVEDGVVRAVELTFRRDLDDPSYHFFRSGEFGDPVPWTVPPVEN